MGALTAEILLIVLLVLLNGFFALSEIAIVSARKARLSRLAAGGNTRARTALALAESPADFLSTVQVGITLIGILAGAFGGATLTRELAALLAGIAWIGDSAEAAAFVMIVLGVTYLSVVVGELVPKRLALGNPERIAAAVAPLMRTFSRIGSPVVRFLSGSTSFALRLLRVRPAADPPVTEDEIRMLIDQGRRAGVIRPAEQTMVDSVFRLGDRSVSAIMTPRKDVIALDADATPAEIREILRTTGHSRYPVCEENLDHTLGMVYTRDLLALLLAGRPLDLREAVTEPLLVPETLSAVALLDRFRTSGRHVALVIDEYGGVQGLVTSDDLLQAIVGELTAGEAPVVVRRDDGSLLVDGLLPLDEFLSLMHLETLPGSDEGDIQTLGGYIMARMGMIPVAGDIITEGGVRFEVVDMDGHRIDKVVVSRPPTAPDPGR
jgi:putative hemolysin